MARPVRNVRRFEVQPRPMKGSTLAGIAEIAYNNPLEWTRIYNANRAGRRRPDGEMGTMHHPQDLTHGQILIIP